MTGPRARTSSRQMRSGRMTKRCSSPRSAKACTRLTKNRSAPPSLHFGKEGGAERFFVNLVQAFAERGLEQRFVIRPDRIWREDVRALGPVIENHYRRLSVSALFMTWRVHRMIRQWRPDAIMSWMSRAGRLMPNDPQRAS